MQFLDSDEKLLKDDKKRKAKRDIVQFVELNAVRGQGNLKEEVMKEIPEQVCGYMESIGYIIDPENLEKKKNEAEQNIMNAVKK